MSKARDNGPKISQNKQREIKKKKIFLEMKTMHNYHYSNSLFLVWGRVSYV